MITEIRKLAGAVIYSYYLNGFEEEFDLLALIWL